MKQPPKPCRQPFTPCWCEHRPKHPKCKEVQSVNIDSGIFILFAIALALIFYKYKQT